MVKTFQAYLPQCHRTYSCIHCRAHLANHDELISKGTVIYTAPELLLGKSPSMKSDIYSLGIIFWQIKYRKTPFEAYDSNESIIYNVAKHNIRPTCDKNNEDLFTNIFTKCWNTESNIRPNTCDILKDLEHIQI